MFNTVKTVLSLVRAVRSVFSCLPVYLFFWFIIPCFSYDLFFNIVLFFDILMIMMRQLFKSRHIHALVKRPYMYNDLQPSTQTIQFECSRKMREFKRRRKKCAKTWCSSICLTAYWKMNYTQRSKCVCVCMLKKGTGPITAVTIHSLIFFSCTTTNRHGIWWWQLAQHTSWN